MTLLEVMVALAILSLLGVRLMSTGTEQNRNLQHLEKRQFALWAASDLAARIHLEGRPASALWQRENVHTGRHQFTLRWRIVTTTYEGMGNVDIEVYENESGSKAIYAMHYLSRVQE